MMLHAVKTKGVEKEFGPMEKLMKKLGFVRWSWDYHKVTYDLKYTLAGIDYYLRLSGSVINDKSLENPKALLTLGTPVFARHFYPHGLDNDALVPAELQAQVDEKLAELEKALHAS
jgi:hypothetical protein